MRKNYNQPTTEVYNLRFENLMLTMSAPAGGGGGGRPNMAQAGGKDPSGIDKAVAEAAKVLEGQIN